MGLSNSLNLASSSGFEHFELLNGMILVDMEFENVEQISRNGVCKLMKNKKNLSQFIKNQTSLSNSLNLAGFGSFISSNSILWLIKGFIYNWIGQTS